MCRKLITLISCSHRPMNTQLSVTSFWQPNTQSRLQKRHFRSPPPNRRFPCRAFTRIHRVDIVVKTTPISRECVRVRSHRNISSAINGISWSARRETAWLPVRCIGETHRKRIVTQMLRIIGMISPEIHTLTSCTSGCVADSTRPGKKLDINRRLLIRQVAGESARFRRKWRPRRVHGSIAEHPVLFSGHRGVIVVIGVSLPGAPLHPTNIHAGPCVAFCRQSAVVSVSGRSDTSTCQLIRSRLNLSWWHRIRPSTGDMCPDRIVCVYIDQQWLINDLLLGLPISASDPFHTLVYTTSNGAPTLVHLRNRVSMRLHPLIYLPIDVALGL